MELHFLLLDAVSAAMRGRQVSWQGQCAPDQWEDLLQLAQAHHVFAMVLDAAYDSPDFLSLPQERQQAWKRWAVQSAAAETMKSVRFLTFYEELCGTGLRPLVMKGQVCRSLFPNPDTRPSSDEDLLVPAAQFGPVAEFLTSRGFQCQNPSQDAFELGFVSRDGLYLELHQTPFSPDSDAVCDCNEPFVKVHDRAVQVPVEGGQVWTMEPQDHMLYLLLHAFKHFIHSGFGVRQICDMILWAERYGAQIQWETVFAQCEKLQCGRFAEAVFQTGYRYLAFDAEKACFPQKALELSLPLEAFVQDMLEGGVFGTADRSRQHSSTVTLGAVEADRNGRKGSMLSAVFPDREKLARAYPYLQRYPFLLPAAWCSRLLRYGKEVCRGQTGSASESMKIGARRKALLRDLDIIQ